MNRDDVLIWLWLPWCVALCGLAILVIFPLWSKIFRRIIRTVCAL